MPYCSFQLLPGLTSNVGNSRRHPGEMMETLPVLYDFEDKSQYYFTNLNVSGKSWVREQFCHQLDFFDLLTAKK